MALEKRPRLGPLDHRALLAEEQHPVGALDFEFVQIRLGVAAAANLARRAEVIDMMMGPDEKLEILETRTHLHECILHHDEAFGQVHAGIDHRPFTAAAIDQPRH